MEKLKVLLTNKETRFRPQNHGLQSLPIKQWLRKWR
jgi:hypothetical protein